MTILLNRYVLSNKLLKSNNFYILKETCGSFFFDKVLIDLRPICNLKCWGCFTKHSHRQDVPGLSLEHKWSVIKELINYGVKTIVFAGQGEPLMDGDIWPIIERSRTLELEVVLYTNGTVLNYMSANRLKDSGVSIIFKRNTFDHDKQNRLFGTKQSYSQIALKNLEMLLEMGMKAPQLAIESYVIRPIIEDLKDVLRFCRRNELLPYFESFLRVGRPEPEDEEWVLSSQELTEVFNELNIIDEKEFNLTVDLISGSRIYGLPPCDKAHTVLGIRNNGDVTLCIHDYRLLGNVAETPLSELLSSKWNPTLRNVYPMGCTYSTASYEPLASALANDLGNLALDKK